MGIRENSERIVAASFGIVLISIATIQAILKQDTNMDTYLFMGTGSILITICTKSDYFRNLKVYRFTWFVSNYGIALYCLWQYFSFEKGHKYLIIGLLGIFVGHFAIRNKKIYGMSMIASTMILYYFMAISRLEVSNKPILILLYLFCAIIGVILKWYADGYSNQLMRSTHILGKSPEGFALLELITDEMNNPYDVQIVYVNQSFLKITEFQYLSIAGKTLLEVLPNLQLQWIERIGQSILNHKSENMEYYSKRTGKLFHLNVFPIEGFRFGLTMKDISPMSDYVEKIEQENLELRERLNQKTSRLNWYNYRLRNTLNPIIGSLDLYKIEEDTALIDMMEQSTDNLLQLANEICCYCEIINYQQSYSKENIEEVIHKAFNYNRNEIICDASKDALIYDSQLLSRVLNLINKLRSEDWKIHVKMENEHLKLSMYNAFLSGEDIGKIKENPMAPDAHHDITFCKEFLTYYKGDFHLDFHNKSVVIQLPLMKNE